MVWVLAKVGAAADGVGGLSEGSAPSAWSTWSAVCNTLSRGVCLRCPLAADRQRHSHTPHTAGDGTCVIAAGRENGNVESIQPLTVRSRHNASLLPHLGNFVLQRLTQPALLLQHRLQLIQFGHRLCRRLTRTTFLGRSGWLPVHQHRRWHWVR